MRHFQVILNGMPLKSTLTISWVQLTFSIYCQSLFYTTLILAINVMILCQRMNYWRKLNTFLRLTEWFLVGHYPLTVVYYSLVALKLSLIISVLLIKRHLRWPSNLEAAARILGLFRFSEHHIKLSVSALWRTEDLSADAVALHDLSTATAALLGSTRYHFSECALSIVIWRFGLLGHMRLALFSFGLFWDCKYLMLTVDSVKGQ